MTYQKTEPASIRSMFGTIAKEYDRTNSVLSLQLHKIWNRKLITEALKRGTPAVYVDLCAGTGEIAFGLLSKKHEKITATLLDFCPEMLEVAKEKARFIHHEIHYVEADAENIPIASNSVDLITMAYGIRNIKHPERAIREARRLLKKGGTFAILELTRPENPLLRFGHSVYLEKVLPFLGGIMTKNSSAYRYLCKSIPNFIPREKLVAMMSEAGFSSVESMPLTGGIATLFIASA